MNSGDYYNRRGDKFSYSPQYNSNYSSLIERPEPFRKNNFSSFESKINSFHKKEF